MEALKEYDYDCFVFSDVDLIPMDDRNTYRCFSQPRHLSVSMDKFGFRSVPLPSSGVSEEEPEAQGYGPQPVRTVATTSTYYPVMGKVVADG